MRRLLKELVTTGKVSGNITTLEDFTVIDAIQKKMASQRIAMSRVGGEGLGMTVKDVYVQGQKIDGKFLAENDIDLNEALYSKI
jgi:hypothetical protein